MRLHLRTVPCWEGRCRASEGVRRPTFRTQACYRGTHSLKATLTCSVHAHTPAHMHTHEQARTRTRTHAGVHWVEGRGEAPRARAGQVHGHHCTLRALHAHGPALCAGRVWGTRVGAACAG